MTGYSHSTPATSERESMSCRAGHYRSFQGSHLGETNDYPSGDVHDTSRAVKTTQEVWILQVSTSLIFPWSMTQVCGIFSNKVLKTSSGGW